MRTIRQRLASLFTVIFCAATIAGCSNSPSPPADPATTAGQSSLPTQKREQILQLSPKVADQLRSMRDRGNLKPSAIIRIAVADGNFFRFKNGGDKRYRYTLRLDDAPKNVDDDFVMESQGLTVHVAKPSAEFLRGTEVVWIESGGRGGFKFVNPNELPDDEPVEQVIQDVNSTPAPTRTDTPTEAPTETPPPR